jgi:hypothetical protein
MVAKEQDQSVDVGRKLISEVNDEAYDLRIESLHNQLECRASIKVHTPENSISPAELISLLNDFDISDSLDLEQLAVFCTAAANGEDPQDFLLATGTQPTTGETVISSCLSILARTKSNFKRMSMDVSILRTSRHLPMLNLSS